MPFLIGKARALDQLRSGAKSLLPDGAPCAKRSRVPKGRVPPYELVFVHGQSLPDLLVREGMIPGLNSAQAAEDSQVDRGDPSVSSYAQASFGAESTDYECEVTRMAESSPASTSIDPTVMAAITGALHGWKTIDVEERLKAAQAEQSEFLERFPISNWPSLELENYALGPPTYRDSFIRTYVRFLGQ